MKAGWSTKLSWKTLTAMQNPILCVCPLVRQPHEINL
jgi:hypothetical protein